MSNTENLLKGQCSMIPLTRTLWDAAFHADGQCWKTDDGASMEDFASGRSYRTDDGQGRITYELEDATVLVIGDGWDYQAEGCTCGRCWEGVGAECRQCPYCGSSQCTEEDPCCAEAQAGDFPD
jgi:hypothetical protein